MRPSVFTSRKVIWAFYIWYRDFVGYLCCPLFLCRAAICCVGCMYEKLGRMMGRSYEETVQILIKSLRSAESQTRIEIMLTLEKVIFFPIKIFVQYALNMLGNTVMNGLFFSSPPSNSKNQYPDSVNHALLCWTLRMKNTISMQVCLLLL